MYILSTSGFDIAFPTKHALLMEGISHGRGNEFQVFGPGGTRSEKLEARLTAAIREANAKLTGARQ